MSLPWKRGTAAALASISILTTAVAGPALAAAPAPSPDDRTLTANPRTALEKAEHAQSRGDRAASREPAAPQRLLGAAADDCGYGSSPCTWADLGTPVRGTL